MGHWFDELSERATRDEDSLSRRSVLKAGGAGLAASVLGAPLAAKASEGLSGLARESACGCHDKADRRYEREIQRYVDGIVTGDPTGGFLYFYNFAALGVDAAALALISTSYEARKLSCGDCKRSPSGDNKPAPPKYVIPPGPVPGVPGGFACPDGTFRCALTSTACCFGGDLCCPCQGDFICCIAAVGCACCG